MNALPQRQVDGDQCAHNALFRQLFDAHFDRVCNAMRRLGVREADVMDEAHNAFMAIYQHMGDYDARGSIKSWVYGFAVRTASNYRRGRGRADRALGIRVDCSTLSHDGVERTAGARDLVNRTLRELPMTMRAVLVMHDMEGMDANEIAQALGMPVNTVYTHLRRARMEFSAGAMRLVATCASEADASTESEEGNRRARVAILSHLLLAAPSQTKLEGLAMGMGWWRMVGNWMGKGWVAAALLLGIGLGLGISALTHSPLAPAQSAQTPQQSHHAGLMQEQPTRRAEAPSLGTDSPSPQPDPVNSAQPVVPSSTLKPSPIARERVLVDTATAALARGMPQQALDALNAHSRQFPDGQMAFERTTLQQRARRMLAEQLPSTMP